MFEISSNIMSYVLYTLSIMCVIVNMHGSAIATSHCTSNLPQTKILKTTMYDPKRHKHDLNLSLEKSMCSTRDTLVDVVSPSPNTLYIPSKVMVKRCDGAAIGKKSCLPTNKVQKEFTVLQMDVLDMRSMFAVVVEIEEHTKCKISCLTMKEDCSPMQKFMGDKCMCVCERIEKCSAVMRWDPNECRCVCQQKDRMCSTGRTWHPLECRCESTENMLYEDVE